MSRLDHLYTTYLSCVCHYCMYITEKKGMIVGTPHGGTETPVFLLNSIIVSSYLIYIHVYNYKLVVVVVVVVETRRQPLVCLVCVHSLVSVLWWLVVVMHCSFY